MSYMHDLDSLGNIYIVKDGMNAKLQSNSKIQQLSSSLPLAMKS